MSHVSSYPTYPTCGVISREIRLNGYSGYHMIQDEAGQKWIEGFKLGCWGCN